jgi:hypothetical protein
MSSHHVLSSPRSPVYGDTNSIPGPTPIPLNKTAQYPSSQIYQPVLTTLLEKPTTVTMKSPSSLHQQTSEIYHSEFTPSFEKPRPVSRHHSALLRLRRCLSRGPPKHLQPSPTTAEASSSTPLIKKRTADDRSPKDDEKSFSRLTRKKRSTPDENEEKLEQEVKEEREDFKLVTIEHWSGDVDDPDSLW